MLGAAACKRLRDDIVARSERIAHAIEKSFLRGGGPTEAEQTVLGKIEAAFATISED